jgi:hypothetical protein
VGCGTGSWLRKPQKANDKLDAIREGAGNQNGKQRVVDIMHMPSEASGVPPSITTDDHAKKVSKALRLAARPDDLLRANGSVLGREANRRSGGEHRLQGQGQMVPGVLLCAIDPQLAGPLGD